MILQQMSVCFSIIAISLSMHAYALNQTHSTQQLKEEITQQLSKDLCGKSHTEPLLILIGGFPGSGKTTLTSAIRNNYDSVSISLDDIRQALLDRASNMNWDVIQNVYQNLLKACLHLHLNVIMDTNAHSEKMEEIELLLNQEQLQNVYRVIKICLNPPYDTLLNRVSAREKLPGIHQGTERDLQRAFTSKILDPKNFDLVIDTSSLSLEQEWEIVRDFLQLYFERQAQLLSL